MKKIFLHGHLQELGESFEFDVASPRMAIRALISQVNGFVDLLKEGEYLLISGDIATGLNIGIEELSFKFGNKCKEFHIIPWVSGSGGRGGTIAKVAVGIALIAVAVAVPALSPTVAMSSSIFGATAGLTGITYGTLAFAGISVALAGAAALMSPQPKLNGESYNNRQDPNERASFLFNGPTNPSQQGVPVPLVYGEMITGSVRISTGINTEVI